MPQFSRISKQRLSTCDRRLQRMLNKIIRYYDCKVLEGHRGKVKQNAAFAKGASKLRWPLSKHNTNPSKAVDVSPYPIPHKWGEDWKDRVKFYELKAIIFYEAERMGFKIRYGGDWDMDGDYKDQTFDDLTHFEIIDD